MDAFLDFQVFLLVRVGSRYVSPSVFRRAGSLRDVRHACLAHRSAVGDSELLSVSLPGSPHVADVGARLSRQFLRMLYMGADRGARCAHSRAARCAGRPAAQGGPPGDWRFQIFVQRDAGIFPKGVWNFSKISFWGQNWPAAQDIRIILKSGIFPKGFWNFSKVSLDFFQGGAGIFPTRCREFSNRHLGYFQSHS